MPILLDYSAGLLTGSAVAGAQADGVIRYAGTVGNPKNTTPGEVASMHAAGRQVHGVFETTTYSFLGGYPAGVANAKALLTDANNCGIDGCLFMSDDQHDSASQIPAWQQYIAGAETVLGARGGAYGFSEAMNAVRGVAHWFWQAGNHPSTTGTAAFVNVWQRNSGTQQVYVSGIQCDINDVLIPLGVDMPLTPADANTVWSADVWWTYPSGSDEAKWLIANGYTADANGNVAVQNATAGALLNVANVRTAVIEDKVNQLLARPTATATVDTAALAAAVVAGLAPHLPPAADPAAIAAAVEATIKAQFNK